MKKVIIMPRKYVQGEGVVSETGQYVGLLGKKPALIWDDNVRDIVSKDISNSLEQNHIKPVEIMFNGECTKNEADRIAEKIKEEDLDVIVGIGGGKTLDTVKAAAAYTGKPLVVIPTIASTDAPTSAMSIWYTEKGEYEGVDFWKFNPDIVIVDTGILVKAPARMFISGIGDALATWYEANASYKSRAITMAGGVQTLTVMSMAKLCLDTIVGYGKLAKTAVEKKVVTPAFERVIEATILLSGIGFESGGLATAHAIASTLPNFFPETHKFLHGENVAFGLMCQLCLEEDLEADEIDNIVDFMIDIGLPVTFADLNMADVTLEEINKFAEGTVSGIPFITNHNFEVTAESLASAVIAADSLGVIKKNNKMGRTGS